MLRRMCVEVLNGVEKCCYFVFVYLDVKCCVLW